MYICMYMSWYDAAAPSLFAFVMMIVHELQAFNLCICAKISFPLSNEHIELRFLRGLLQAQNACGYLVCSVSYIFA